MLCNNYQSDQPVDKISEGDFDKMNKIEKVATLFKGGHQLFCREDSVYIISLYFINDFFAEIWYQSSSRKIERIEITTQGEVMANYEQEIDISDLF